MTAHRFLPIATALCLASALVSADATASPRQITPDASLRNSTATGGRPSVRTPFPSIKNWNSLVIGLERSACYGTCPVYHVEIHGDGTVVYIGDRFVAIAGERQEHISRSAVQHLFSQFRSANYFWSFDRYTAPVTDLPENTTSIAFDEQSKSVEDYGGGMIGMPPELIALEGAIDQLANTGKWIKAADPRLDR